MKEEKTFNFLKFKNLFLFIFFGIFIFSVFSIFYFKIKIGLDFKGGMLIEIEFEKEKPSPQEIRQKLSELNLGEIIIQKTEKNRFLLKMREISEKEKLQIFEKLKEAREVRSEMVGPAVSLELKRKSAWLTIFSLITISVYIAFAFRRITKNLSPFVFSSISFLGLFQNTTFLLGVIAIFGKFFNTEFNIPILIAILTCLGYGINDTIVLFDRIRENVLKRKTKDLSEIINFSISQTFTRQVNTSLVTIFPVLAILLFNVESLKFFSLILVLGILNSTFFSLFIAGSILRKIVKTL
jgi:preprotein translocase subunit SecF